MKRGPGHEDAEDRLAADQGDAFAQFNLGGMYRDGRGVAQDDEVAVRWLRLAADQGDAFAQFNLGGMYRDGWDDREAVRWLRLASEQGHAEVQAALGLMRGRGSGGGGVTKRDAGGQTLFEALRAERSALAARQGLPPYFVCPDASLVGMAARRPRSLKEFALIPGVGAGEVELYGAAFVAVIRAHDRREGEEGARADDLRPDEDALPAWELDDVFHAERGPPVTLWSEEDAWDPDTVRPAVRPAAAPAPEPFPWIPWKWLAGTALLTAAVYEPGIAMILGVWGTVLFFLLLTVEQDGGTD